MDHLEDPRPDCFIPGQTCWRVEASRRMAFLIDAQSYFAAIADAFARAKRRIVIVGWDFDSRIHLRNDESDGKSTTLGEYLRALVEENPRLDIHILIWRNSLFYANNSDVPLLPFASWWDHPRIHYRLDDRHPVTASHHEKIVTVDDAIAFIGGMDLTDGRWDDKGHQPDNPRRTTAGQVPYGPVHDVHSVLDGDAARALADIARTRWHDATGEVLPPIAAEGEDSGDPWPAIAPAIIGQQSIAISRTRPLYETQAEVREIEAMNAALIASAQRAIYIETQYFALPQVADLLAQQLERESGPEVVVVATLHAQGAIEHYIMADTRDRLFADLQRRDRFGRLRTYYPASCPDPLCDIKIHSKLIIVDDRLLRIGSSNLNARSIGLDTECDICIAGETATARQGIVRLRHQLLAEHVGVDRPVFDREFARTGSLIAAIDSLNTGDRRLMDFPTGETSAEPLVPIGRIFDPPRPLDLQYIIDAFKPSR
jgi:phosphatidylserine/phosphatidylglycerophosphate/cardiolipin synthase-like enzyme